VKKIILALAVLLFTSHQLYAQSTAGTFPSQPIHLVIPTGAGGITDILGRTLAEKLGAILGQTVIVENRTGASGVIGSAYVARAKPDGYTLLMSYPSHTVNPNTIKKMPYDTVRDFAPVAKVGSASEILAFDAKGDIKTTQDLIAAAKAHPGKLSYGAVGVGSLGEYCTLLLQSRAGIKMERIPYSSEPELVAAIIRGDIVTAFLSPPAALPMIRGGRIIGAAISDPAGLPILPDMPTIDKSGLPGYDATSWSAVFAPASTPASIVDTLNAAINKALKDPALVNVFKAQGVNPLGGTPAALQKSVVEDISRMGKTLRAAGIEPA
jgi:tripartite-type tricarboxylate transporter receptor subunit TctC